MITLILSSLNNVDFGVVLGYILSGLECLIVIITLLSFFVPSDSKFGQILSFILKGLYKSKNYVKEEKESITGQIENKNEEGETNEINTNGD